MKKSELLSIRRAPQVTDKADAFPDLGPERAFDPHPTPRSPPHRGELTRARPVGPDDVLRQLARNSAHRRNSGQGSLSRADASGRRAHEDSKLASLRGDRCEARGPETKGL